MSHDILEQLLSYGVCAPSGDNSQPWSFSYDESVLSVFAHPEKDHPILNVENGGTYIACGALLENISIAAIHFGFNAKIELCSPTNSSTKIAHITFQKITNTKNDDTLFKYIKLRHTNRKTYSKKTVPQNLIDTLFVSPVEETTTVSVTDSESIRTLANNASKMEKIALETKQLHRLFFDDIFFDTTKNTKGESGLYIQTMELPPPIQLLFRILGNWKVMKILLTFRFQNLVSITNAKLYASAPLLGAIFVQNNQPQAYIKAGMQFQKIWLRCTKYGLSVQPIVGINYLYKYVSAEQTQKIISEHNVQLLTKIATDFEKVFHTNKIPVMLFRIGYAQKPTAVSHRKPPCIEYTSR